MICIQKIYGFHGINRQNIEKSWYVTPVTDGRTNERRRKVENRAVFWIESETAKSFEIVRWYRFSGEADAEDSDGDEEEEEGESDWEDEDEE